MMRRTSGGLFKRESGPRARRFTLRVLSSAALLLCLSVVAQAATSPTYVSAEGDDANDCGRADPCRTFSGAYGKTVNGGEIIVLDSGEYGTLTITQSLRITAQGVYARVNGYIAVSAAATDVIVLRGLTLNKCGFCMNASGISYTAGGVLYVENCSIRGYGGQGINFTGAGQLYVKDTVIRHNSSYGIYVSTATGRAKATIEHSWMEKNSIGVYAAANSTVAVRDSVAAGNTSHGFYSAAATTQMSIEGSAATQNGGAGVLAFGGQVSLSRTMLTHNTSYGVGATGSSSKVSVEDCAVTNNQTGIYVTSAGVAALSNTTVSGNSFGLYNVTSTPGVLSSFGNNRVFRNTTDKTGPITVTPLS